MYITATSGRRPRELQALQWWPSNGWPGGRLSPNRVGALDGASVGGAVGVVLGALLVGVVLGALLVGVAEGATVGGRHVGERLGAVIVGGAVGTSTSPHRITSV